MNSIPDRIPPSATLDGLFRRAAIRDPDAVALADPPNKKAVTGGDVRILTYAEADRIVWRLAGRLRAFGLPHGGIVAFQLPNTVECIVTLLAIARAGLVAAPLPLLWRHADIVAALAHTDAKVLITASRVDGLAPLATVMHSAANLFTVRYVCAFGPDVPHDLIGLDDVFEPDGPGSDKVTSNHAQSGDDPVVVTFDITPDGPLPVSRTHQELLAGGPGWVAAAGMTPGANLLSATPVTSFGGLATTLTGWLLCGGTLALHHPFDADAFEHQCGAWCSHAMILPGPLALRMSESLTPDTAAVIALWPAPERLAMSQDWQTDAARLVDVSVFGETALWAAARGPDGRPASVLPAHLSTAALQATRTVGDTLALRGTMVPQALCRSALAAGNGQPWAETGLPCRFDPVTGALTPQGASPGLVQVGGYRLAQTELDRIAAQNHGTLVALPDGLNGRRIVGRLRTDETLLKLENTGINHLILNAFKKKNASALALIER